MASPAIPNPTPVEGVPPVPATPPTPEVASPGQPAPTPDPRQAIIDQYRSLGYDGGPRTPAVPAAPVAAPAPLEPPAAEPSSPVGGDVSRLAAELAEVKALLAKFAEAPAEPEPPAAPAAPVPPTEDIDEQWFALVREGKIKEANTLLRKSVLEEAKATLLGPLIEETRAELEQRAAVQSQIDQFNTEMRTKASDVIEMGFEPQIANAVEFIISTKLANKEITSGPQLVEVYKAVVLSQIEEARKLAQRIRGAGANQAREAAAAAAAASATAVPGDTRPPAPPTAPKPKTPTEIIAERAAANLAIRGLAV